ncbi:MAG: DUF6580 family putative transport protein [Patescibacteria group bacterium]|jgi:hypothetical protein
MKMISWKKLSFALLLVVVGVIGRYLLLDFPNVETMTAVALLAGALLGGGYTVVVPLLAVAVFDIFYGNSSILFFTWSAWAIIGLIGLVLKGKKMKTWKFTASMAGLGVASSLFFYIWTNFGVWLIGDWYPETLSGLMTCMIAGLPFLKAQIMGNLIVVPLTAVSLNYVWQRVNALQFKLVKNKPKKVDIVS